MSETNLKEKLVETLAFDIITKFRANLGGIFEKKSIQQSGTSDCFAILFVLEVLPTHLNAFYNK